jgi:hypothetical protein
VAPEAGLCPAPELAIGRLGYHRINIRRGVGTMKCLVVLLCALLFALAFGAGCEPGPFDDAVRDWNGDNMQMRSFGGGAMPPSKVQQQ